MEDSHEIQDLFNFAVRLYQQTGKDTSGNMVISPHSVSVVLAMLLGGARENTANQLIAVLGRHGYEALRNLKTLQSAKGGDEDETIFLSANKLFFEQTFVIQENFLKESEKDFSISVSSLDFRKKAEESRSFINEWAKEQTNGKIENPLPPGSINALTKLVIANAIYFKGMWAKKFQKSKTAMSKFYLSKGKKCQVKMMSQQTSLKIHHDRDFGAQIVELPYKNGHASMILIVPTERFGLKSLEAKLSSKKLQNLIEKVSLNIVALSLPTMKIDFSVDLVSAFKALGVNDVFDSKQANLKGISSVPDLYVSGIFHKTFLEVNEEGTEAAAVTVSRFRVLSLSRSPPSPVVVTCDHPFMVLIKDNSTNSILFMGRIASP